MAEHAVDQPPIVLRGDVGPHPALDRKFLKLAQQRAAREQHAAAIADQSTTFPSRRAPRLFEETAIAVTRIVERHGAVFRFIKRPPRDQSGRRGRLHDPLREEPCFLFERVEMSADCLVIRTSLDVFRQQVEMFFRRGGEDFAHGVEIAEAIFSIGAR